MSDLLYHLLIALSGLGGLAITAAAGLHGWNGWLDLKRAELERGGGQSAPASPAATRIEVADMKERIRRLEAIAAGVDL